MKKILILTTVVTCFAFTPKKEYNINYIEVVNTLQDMQEWLVVDIQNKEISQELGRAYLQNIDECLSRLEDMDYQFQLLNGNWDECENCE
tara:strand:- start:122 stop:391 length:270 start_codon:yes stop_codon:yes gene_type:complete